MISKGVINRAGAVPIEDELARRGWIDNLERCGRERIGPCPVCGGRDLFAINVVKQVFLCRHCNVAGDVIRLVQHLDGCSFAKAIATLTADLPRREILRPTAPRGHRHDDDEPGRIRSALRFWSEASSFEGALVTTYLNRERGIVELPPDPHEVLRFHPRVVFGRDERGFSWVFRPCILALLRDVMTDEACGVHRIALTADGELIGRRALGRKKGAAIKLWGHAEVTAGLVVGEGLETVLAAATMVEHRGTLLRPAWACVDAGNLKTFPVLAGIEYLTVLADNDENGGGQEASRACARRWADAGLEAEVLIPDITNQDFNDITKGVMS